MAGTDSVAAGIDVFDPHVPHDARVLEVGCGSSPHTRTTVGLDREPTAVRTASTKIRYVVGDAERMPFAHNSFEVILARGVLHHLTSLATFLAEAVRVLDRPGLILALDAEPMPTAEFADMTGQLMSAGAQGEPRNGVDSELLRERPSSWVVHRCRPSEADDGPTPHRRTRIASSPVRRGCTFCAGSFDSLERDGPVPCLRNAISADHVADQASERWKRNKIDRCGDST